jgi:flavin-dependent dehydrogenase
MVGDAAWVLDPASSHGVLRALMSGMQAAHLICRMLRRPAEEAVCARSYREWMRSWYLNDEAALRDFYAELPSPPPWLATFPMHPGT